MKKIFRKRIILLAIMFSFTLNAWTIQVKYSGKNKGFEHARKKISPDCAVQNQTPVIEK